MTAEQQDQPEQLAKAKARARRSRPLAAHPAFAPMLGLWGAALAGLSVIVLPAGLFARLAAQAGLALPTFAVQCALAVFSAMMLGGALYALARRIGRGSPSPIDEAQAIVAAANRRLRTIDPQRDLGSASLDEPVTTIPFAAVFPEEDGEIAVPVVDQPPAPPRSLDLAEFADLPGRNAVWVEEQPSGDHPDGAPPEGDTSAAPGSAAVPLASRRKPAITPPGATALAQLRAQPPEQLSLIQMVERFAGALHEHRTAPPGKPMSAQDIAAREAALTEALKALAALSGNAGAEVPTTPQDEPLREALTRLQGLEALRGAA